MPKLPDDMSQAAIKKREVISAATKAKLDLLYGKYW